MQQVNAAAIANDIIKLLLTHQQNPLGTSPLLDEADAQKAAKTLAAFRKELIALLKDEPA